jgi:hypothetical protein
MVSKYLLLIDNTWLFNAFLINIINIYNLTTLAFVDTIVQIQISLSRLVDRMPRSVRSGQSTSA